MDSRPRRRSPPAVRDIERLLEAATALGRAETEAEAAQITAGQAMELLGADRVQVMCADGPGSSRFVNRGQCNIPVPLGEAHVDAATEPSGTGLAVRTGQTVFVADAATSPVVSPHLARLLDPKSMVFLPLPGEGGYLGAVVAIWNSPRAGLDRFSQRAAELLSVEAGQALERTRAADLLARDLGEHREAEASFRRERVFLRLLNAIAVAANEASSVEEALQRALDEVCAYTGWAVGHVYVPDEPGILVSTKLWHLDDADRLRAFQEMTEQTPLSVGNGLPGRVAASGRPAWVTDVTTDPNFPRASAADQVGIKAAMGFPVLLESAVVAVLEFFTVERLEPDESLLELATHVGTQLSRVMERRRAEDALRASEERTRAVIETAGDAFIGMDNTGRVTDWNRQAEVLFGWSREEATGKPVADLIIPPALRPAHRQGLRRFLASGKTTILGQRLELHGQTRDGREFPVELTVWATRLGPSYVFNAFIHDISERKHLEAELTRQALHDPLTALANRTLLIDRMAHALTRAERSEAPTTVLFLDLDGFKTVNDSLGHATGDELLVLVADRLRGSVRPADTIARLGGDEFAVLLEDTGTEGGTQTAERVGEALASAFHVGGREVTARASIGIATGEPGQRSADELLRDADLAMYMAKRLGKGRHAVFEAAMHTTALERLELEADLRRALPAGEILVHYQPIVRLADGSLVGMEALVRWNRPGHGLVSPLEFIPVAEETALILEIGAWVLEEACRQVGAWQGEYRLSPPPHLSVNLSARQLQNPALVGEVAAALARSGLDPAGLVIEITESMLMEEPEHAVERLRGLKGLGVRLAIDDFGTGYSSLSYLRRFPVDVLKIDKAFVAALLAGPEDAALAHAIVRLAHTLHLGTVAEGIETAEQLAELCRLGCEFGQGYLFAAPLSSAAMADVLRTARQHGTLLPATTS
ncbi:MAG TPA: EAL domain-containing protein [Actinomycetota bacterium]|nr:EAL domain-containing protein [Actinomycetota bacterium]